LPVTKSSYYRGGEHFAYYVDGNATSIRHSSDAIRTQIKMSSIEMDSKIRVYLILIETSRPQNRIQVILKIYKETETVGFFFTKERKIICCYGKIILVRLHRNFSYVLNSEVTFKRLRWKGTLNCKQGTLNCKQGRQASRHNNTLQLESDGTRAEIRFRPSVKWTIPT
jgi:hypothetical protein